MIILAIDTSCDDTCIAILKIANGKLKILSNIVSSQVKIHRKYGGVYPSLAKREHQKNLPSVLERALYLAKLSTKRPEIDLIAVTVGPGLDPCLWMGINFAKDLAQQWNLPIIPVNHIEAHIVANFLPKVSSNFQFHYTTPSTLPPSAGPFFFNFQKIFPAICLVVSGGHTQLILMEEIGKYKIIGETRDDAAGECFDKTARVLGLPYPGGPAIAAAAAKYRNMTLRGVAWGASEMSKYRIKLPRPMINSKDYDLSFSGLKTAVLYDFKNRSKKVRVSKEYVREMAKEIQQAIVDVLIKKTIKAARNYQVKTIMLGGGVAANDELREQLNKECLTYDVKHLVPPKNLCTDNAAMVGVAGYFSREKTTKNFEKIKANANLRI